MDQLNPRRKKKTACDACARMTPAYDIIHHVSLANGTRALCSRCLNTEIATSDGLAKFEHVEFEPVELTDCDGLRHKFHFQVHLFGPGVSLHAFELRDGEQAGYQFGIIDEPECDLLLLLGRLIEKIRRGLSSKHLVEGDFGLQIAPSGIVRGRIEWDPAQHGDVPKLLIDGREVAWDQFGRMLMTCEGSQFKLEIRDVCDEI